MSGPTTLFSASFSQLLPLTMVCNTNLLLTIWCYNLGRCHCSRSSDAHHFRELFDRWSERQGTLHPQRCIFLVLLWFWYKVLEKLHLRMSGFLQQHSQISYLEDWVSLMQGRIHLQCPRNPSSSSPFSLHRQRFSLRPRLSSCRLRMYSRQIQRGKLHLWCIVQVSRMLSV